MYAAALVMLLGIPIALGSWWGVLIVVAIVPALIWRLLDEEKFLARNLPVMSNIRAACSYHLLPLLSSRPAAQVRSVFASRHDGGAEALLVNLPEIDP